MGVQANAGALKKKVKGGNLDLMELQKYKKSAEKGNAIAQCYVGVIYRQGKYGVTANDEIAVKWYSKAACQGYAPAQCHLGVMLKNGRGCEQNDVAAAQWFLKSAIRGEANAAYYLGAMYHVGRGVDQDDKLALKYWTQAAENGHVAAQRAMASLHLEGQMGLEKDDVQAAKWLRKASMQEDPTATRMLREVEARNPDAVHQSRKRWKSAEFVTLAATKMKPKGGPSEDGKDKRGGEVADSGETEMDGLLASSSSSSGSGGGEKRVVDRQWSEGEGSTF